MSRLPALIFFVLAAGGCAGLTAPPSPEPVASATVDQANVKGAPAGQPSAAPQPAAPAPTPTPAPQPAVQPSPGAGAAAPAAANAQLGIQDVVVGKGAEAKQGSQAFVQYVGKLADGTQFDSSYKHGGKPFPFVVGAGKVIKGWDQGVAGMKVGGKRKLTIPPSLAYGDHGVPGTIPPNSTLVFDVELVDVK